MAKKLKIKVPKRVAGVKIPKSVRKGPIAGFLNSTAGQIVIAEALVASTGAFALKGTDPDSAAGDALRHPIENLKRAGRLTADATSGATERAADRGAHLSFALGEAVKAFRAAMERDDWKPARATSDIDTQPEGDTRLDIETPPVGKKKPTTTPPIPH